MSTSEEHKLQLHLAAQRGKKQLCNSVVHTHVGVRKEVTVASSSDAIAKLRKKSKCLEGAKSLWSLLRSNEVGW